MTNDLKLVKMAIKTDDKSAPTDFLYQILGMNSRFLEGKEYVPVKRNLTDTAYHFFMKDSLIKAV